MSQQQAPPGRSSGNSAENLPATSLAGAVFAVLASLIPLIGICWALSVFDRIGVYLVSQQIIAVMLGLACAAAYLRYPYATRAGLFELVLSALSAACWWWMAVNFIDWTVRLADRTPDMWLPGVIAILLLLEAVRKALGVSIAILVWVFVAYAFFGDYVPGPLQAEVYAPTKSILYLYADGNGIPGIVLRIVIELVLAFVIFGKLLQMAGGTQFLNDLALGFVGHKAGGSAKVAIIASSLFGSMSGSTVGNIMSTGVVTIPMMKRAGFRAEVAAAVEAVSSNGGQLMPPVMGTTAFIIAEFLAIPYTDVVLAALLPALLYYLTLFVTVDAIAVASGIQGVPRAQLPPVRRTLQGGWVFLLPLALLLYLLFWVAFNPGRAALYAAGVLFLMFVAKRRGKISLPELGRFLRETGSDLIPLLLIGGAAGMIIGVMNSTGFAFQLSLMLTAVAEGYGLLAMLGLTALLCIALGLGMPTAAVYIVVVTVIAPTLTDLGMVPLAAHMFLFYFGLMSMLTPPVAIGSMVAASVAGADMWRTGKAAVWMGLSAYLLPFLWAYNPALLAQGSWQAITLVAATGAAAALLLGRSMTAPDNATQTWPPGVRRCLYLSLALITGSATVWLGPQNWLALVPAALALALDYRLRRQTGATAATQQDG